MIRKGIIFVILMLFALVVSANANTIYSGNLTTNDGGVVATGPWSGTGAGFQITWNVTQTGNLFHYEYGITNATGGDLEKDISHILIQVSDNFTVSDITNVTGGTLSSDSPKLFSGPSNPNIPSPLFSLKFDPSIADNATIAFDSTRMPMWGNFYTKDGKAGGIDVTAWNSGFGNVEGAKIGVPDTQVVPIPGTGFLLLGGIGMMYFVGTRKRDA